MTEKIVKAVLIVLMTAGIIFSLLNFIVVKSEANAIWQKLETGIDPVTGGVYVRCWSSGQACVVVFPLEED